MQLDWIDLMQGYNYKFKTAYADIKTWLAEIHELRTGEQNARLLGIADMSFYNKIRALEIPAKKRGARREVS